MRADGDLGVGELLDLFSVLVAGGAFVFVKRHWFSLFLAYLVAGRSVRCDFTLRLRDGWLGFGEFDDANAGDGFHLAQGFDDGGCGGGVGDVDLDYGERLSLRDSLRADRTAQGEVGDVDRVLAEDRADLADDAGDVVVADGDEGAVERGLDVDAVVGEQAGRVAVEHGGGGAGVAGGGVEDDLEDRACTAGGELLLVFLDADAALLGDGRGVDAVGGAALLLAVALSVGEDAGDGGVADEVGFAGGEAAGVGDLDVLQVSRRRVGEEVTQALGHLDVGGDLDVLLVREGGQVDRVLDDAELEVVADLHGELDADGLLGFVGGSCDVGERMTLSRL